MVFLNFLIAIITHTYEDVIEVREEEAYKRKAGILRDLDEVFGDYVDSLPVNILVTRRKMEKIEREEVN
jgi:predicted RNase H-like nuclease (RuvC/YqgF family)